jgi:hypothetical protein
MARKAQVISDPSLERDLNSNAIVSKNAAAYQARIAHKHHSGKKAEELAELRDTVQNLAAQLEELKAIVNKKS